MVDIEAVQKPLLGLTSFVLFNRAKAPEPKLADIPSETACSGRISRRD